MIERITQAVGDALQMVGAGDAAFAVEWPADLSHGDYATNAALVAAKTLGKNPKALAEELVPHIAQGLGNDAESVTVAGPGFINITVSREHLTRDISVAAKGKELWGVGDANQGKRVMVEYSCPNPFKEMHIGHMMSTIIGEAVSRVFENSGATVMRDSYGGDVGPHVAKAIWGLTDAGIHEPGNAAEIGKAYAHGTRAYEESEKAKAEIDALNKQIYIGEDQNLMEIWRKGREVALTAFREIYQTLGTKFDYYFFESETATPGTEIVQRHVGDVFEESEGAIIYRGEKKGLHTLVFITSQGTPTYEAKEIGLAFMREERCPSDLVFILTAAEQVGHFRVVHAALEDIAPMLAAKTTHIPHGFLRLTTGKMSSREGTIITATALINDVIAKVSLKNADPVIAEQVAVGAIKYSILKQSTGSDIVFDFDQSLSLDGDSGPYLQYSLVRAKSVLATAAKEGSGDEVPDEPYLIERLIARYPEVAARAERERAPHHVAQYLTQLAGEWNSFYANNRIIDGEYEAYKLLIARAFATTMENGLRILGIPTPEKM